MIKTDKSPKAAASEAVTTPDRETLVRQAAYAIYEQQGCISGRELEHWIAAEALVDQTLKPKKARASRAAPRTKPSGGTAH